MAADDRSEPAVARAISRQALYERVWAEPLSQVAVDLGLSRNGLAKICDRLMIPYPGRGHWTGSRERASPPSLPPAPGDAGESITLEPGRARSRRTRARLPREVRTGQLIDAAARIALAEGLAAVSIRRVAREVGLSEAQGHNHYPRRIDLLLALTRRELAAVAAAQAAEIARGETSLERVERSTRAYLRQAAERGALVQRLLDDREIRAGLRPERESRSRTARRRAGEQMHDRYGVRTDVGLGATAVLTAVTLRAGRLIGEGKASLDLAERLSMAVINAGNRAVAGGRRKDPPADG